MSQRIKLFCLKYLVERLLFLFAFYCCGAKNKTLGKSNLGNKGFILKNHSLTLKGNSRQKVGGGKHGGTLLTGLFSCPSSWLFSTVQSNLPKDGAVYIGWTLPMSIKIAFLLKHSHRSISPMQIFTWGSLYPGDSGCVKVMDTHQDSGLL